MTQRYETCAGSRRSATNTYGPGLTKPGNWIRGTCPVCSKVLDCRTGVLRKHTNDKIPMKEQK